MWGSGASPDAEQPQRSAPDRRSECRRWLPAYDHPAAGEQNTAMCRIARSPAATKPRPQREPPFVFGNLRTPWYRAERGGRTNLPELGPGFQRSSRPDTAHFPGPTTIPSRESRHDGTPTVMVNPRAVDENNRSACGPSLFPEQSDAVDDAHRHSNRPSAWHRRHHADLPEE